MLTHQQQSEHLLSRNGEDVQETDTVGKRLKQARKRSKLSLAAVEQETGIPKSTYRSWESDTHSPPFEKAVELALLFDVSLDWLAGIKKPAPDEPGRADEQDGMRGLVDPRHVEPVETSKTLTGYFDFHDRIIKVSLLVEAFGPPGRFGGYSPDEPGTDEGS